MRFEFICSVFWIISPLISVCFGYTFCLHLQCRRCRQQLPPKRRCVPTKLHRVTAQTTVIGTPAGIKTSDLTNKLNSWYAIVVLSVEIEPQKIRILQQRVNLASDNVEPTAAVRQCQYGRREPVQGGRTSTWRAERRGAGGILWVSAFPCGRDKGVTSDTSGFNCREQN
jgi:hypothetical protein